MEINQMRSEISILLEKAEQKYTIKEIESMTGRRWDQLDRFANWNGRVEKPTLQKLKKAIEVMRSET